MLKEIYPNCAGLDVHKRFVTACRLTVDAQGVTHPQRRKFSTMTADLEELASWLAVRRSLKIKPQITRVNVVNFASRETENALVLAKCQSWLFAYPGSQNEPSLPNRCNVRKISDMYSLLRERISGPKRSRHIDPLKTNAQLASGMMASSELEL